jgi:threonine synthase
VLYVTTRSKHDVYTAPITLKQNRAPDGGFFVPFRLPELDKDYLRGMAGHTFGENVADMLNLFFPIRLSGWDVDIAVSRSPVKIRTINRKTLVAEMFHNMERNFDRIVNALSIIIHPDGEIIGKYTDWSDIAVRISLLFGIFGELLRTEQITVHQSVDVAISAGNFAGPMACWYARQMGLPIGNIIVGCNENGSAWDLLHRGQVITDALAVKTSTPECDYAVVPDLERLICATCGHEESMNFCWSCTEGSTYKPIPEAYEAIRRGMFAAVVSQDRVDSIIPNLYRTNHYVPDLYSALAYGALMDYRSRTGTNNMTLLLAQNGPMSNPDAVARAMRMSVFELRHCLSEV